MDCDNGLDKLDAAELIIKILILNFFKQLWNIVVALLRSIIMIANYKAITQGIILLKNL